MKLSAIISLSLSAIMVSGALAYAKPQVFPVGTVKYNPAKTFNSYVVFASNRTVKVVDRNGNLVKEWDNRSDTYGYNKVLPGGHVLTTLYPNLKGGMSDHNTVAILDWDGNIVRKFNHLIKVDEQPGAPKDANGETWVSRQHHDSEIEGMSTGYYAPGQQPKLDGKMLVLAHENVKHPGINPNVLLDDIIVIVDKDENILWKWNASDHFEEFGFSIPAVTKTQSFRMAKSPTPYQGIDWFHINCASWLGPNKWYDAGDKRFHPENIICDSRQTSHLFIIDHESGEIVWQVAPPFVGADAQLAPIAGVHGTHMIPKGLPGEGNILIFDNGGALPPNVYKDQEHGYSRVLEFDPVTKKKVWEYSGPAVGIVPNMADNFFLSQFISNAQRLPNGNTLICEGAANRIFEVTPERETVWEYINPYNNGKRPGFTYRAYAVPYDFIPQLQKPEEISVTPPRNEVILVPNDKGGLPDYKPTIDKGEYVQFGDSVPLLTPALAEKLGLKK